MTLHIFLERHGIRLSKSDEARLGNLIAERFYEQYKYLPIKVYEASIKQTVNDYPNHYLPLCMDIVEDYYNNNIKEQNNV